MKPCTVITEGPADAALLEAVLALDPNVADVRVVAAGGWSSADSLARSMLIHGREDVALVVDADSTDPVVVNERQRFLEGSLREVVPTAEWRVFVIAPEVEALLFEDPAVAETVAGRPLSEAELVRGRFQPREVLRQLLNGHSLTEAMGRLRHLDLSPLQQLPIVRELRDFASGVSRTAFTEA
jgi:hypothetical protein